MGRVVGGVFRMKGIRGCLWPTHVHVWQKPSHYCKVIILQLKFKNEKGIYEKIILDTEMKIFTLT